MRPLDDLFEKSAGLGDPPGSPQPQEPKPRSTAMNIVPSVLGTMVAGPVGGAGAGALVSKLLKKAPDEQIQQEAMTEFMDPAHEAELTKIRTQAMLSEFMATDPVISTYDPEELASAYNQVVQLTPRAALQPAVMRGLLRRFLQQQDALEPHEAGQLAGIESQLKGLQEPAKLPLAPPVSLKAVI